MFRQTLFLALALSVASEAYASDTKPGCEYKFLSPGFYGGQPFRAAETISARYGVLDTTITVEYADHKIAGCQAHLRNYNGRLVGPTLRARPGDVLSILLKNKLPPETAPPPTEPNTPHNFNTTNFHTHGLHVSPAGNSDNVLVNIGPGEDFQIEIKIPRDHPTGTFWYHAHTHGSTALQVSSGMAGALIIEDPDDPHSLDANPAIKAAKEDIILLQQISYDEKGEVENYKHMGPGSWGKSQRLPTINGQIMPVIEMQPGEVRRWRMIHGGIRETFMVALMDTEKPGTGGQGERQPLFEIAVDGLSLGYMNQWSALELQPGYRVDALFKAPPLADGKTEQVYYLMDVGTDASTSLRETVEAAQVLAKVVVSGAQRDMSLPCQTSNAPCPALAPTRPHKDVADHELNGEEQTVEFNIGAYLCPQEGGPCTQPCNSGDEGCALRFMVNDWPFNSSRTRVLELGTASKWMLSSKVASHPFHIHVNPFQSTRMGPNGNPETVWRDTLLVRSGADPVEIRSRYTRYIGRFVLHCHILDHEDQGMMEIVEVAVPTAGHDTHAH